MPRLTRGAGEALTDALAARAARLGGRLAKAERRSCGWASVTLTGERHALALTIEGRDAEAAADAFMAGLEEQEFALPGQVLADIVLIARASGEGRVRLDLEALTVEEN